ncbi:hypothetical protein ATCVCanal1_764L [Acanthocystis turfacea Chlorella virus Canal-1]|nr:hypothetical protein ATCVCanal1_764L [Acanthocystis turfacea Chlorella virus Canal-1]
MSNKMVKLPTSGSEEMFTDFVYGSGIGKQSNNCYSFAIDYYGKNKRKLQPGEISKTLKPEDDLTDPKILKERVLADLATKKDGGYLSSPCVKCKEGYYKAMAFVDKGRDYHWYRQMGDMITDANGKNMNTLAKNMNVSKSQLNLPQNSEKVLVQNSGLWAHKRGLSELTVKDASGKYIVDPRNANRNYDSLNYKTYVASFCINAKFGKGGPVSCNNKKNA